jgi:hypothetical protein
MRARAGLALVVTALVLGTPAAAMARSRVGVQQFKGAGEGPVRAKVVKAIKANGFQLVGAKQIESTASKLGVNLEGDDGWSAVAKELNVSAFVTGELTRKKASLTVRNGADGAVAGQASFAGANPKKIKAAVAAGFWRQLGTAIKHGQPPSGAKAKSVVAEEAEPADDEAGGTGAEGASGGEDEPRGGSKAGAKASSKKSTAAGDDEKAGDDDDTSRRHRAAKARPAEPKEPKEASEEGAGESAGLPPPVALELGVGVRALFRNLAWNQDPQRRMVPYSLSPGPEAGFWLDLYPASFITGGVASQIGLFGGFNNGFGVVSTTDSGSKLTTNFRDYLAGLKMRFPLGAFIPYVAVAYGGQSFILQGQPAGGNATVPGVDYKFIRAGAGAGVTFTRKLSMDLNADYLLVNSVGSQPGQIGSSDFFSRAKAFAVDAGVSLAYRATSLLAVRAGADFRQYGLDFHVRPTDPLIVGGATDRYITVWTGLEIVLDGLGRVESDEQEAPAAEPAPKAGAGRKPQKGAEPAKHDDEDDDAG